MENVKEKLFTELNDLFGKIEYKVVKQELFAQLFQDIEHILNKYPYYPIYKIFKFSISETIMSDNALDIQLKQFNMERVYNFVGYIGNNNHVQIVIAKEKPLNIFIKGEIKLC